MHLYNKIHFSRKWRNNRPLNCFNTNTQTSLSLISLYSSTVTDTDTVSSLPFGDRWWLLLPLNLSLSFQLSLCFSLSLSLPLLRPLNPWKLWNWAPLPFLSLSFQLSLYFSFSLSLSLPLPLQHSPLLHVSLNFSGFYLFLFFHTFSFLGFDNLVLNT